MPHHCNFPLACYEGPLRPSLVDACPGPNFFVFMSLLNSLIQNHKKISGSCKRVIPIDEPHETYDFVVVGGGTAGSIVAGRLSENSAHKTLVLEAGPDVPVGTGIPSFATKFLGTDITWDYKTENEKHACLASNGSCPWPSGKNLGGNMEHNGMIYLRGHSEDYDEWAAMGNVGWTWAEVQPFFKKSENNEEIDRVGREHHATGGPVSVGRFRYKPDFAYDILNASIQAGFGISEDLNGDKKTGFSIIQATTKDGMRHSTARAYLWPARNRRNLHVAVNSTVTKLIIRNRVVIGVEYVKNGRQRCVYVTKEVILSASVVESPHILMLSGIGPREHLESKGIKVVHDLPGVGENLHDHPCAILSFTINEPNIYDNNWAVAEEYLSSQTGPLSAIGAIQAVGMLTSNRTTPNRPDIELYLYSHHPSCAPGETGALQSPGKRPLLMLPSALYPKSRGRITLRSKDPFESPVIWNNYLNHTDDVAVVVDAIKKGMALTKTEAFRRLNVTLTDTPLRACANHEFQSDEYWACIARQVNYPLYHQAGTCKMGPSSDPMAVVDPRLRVHGIRGLRIADISIMPKVPGSNTAAPAMMVGERCAHFIKEDWDNHHV